jgi:polyhydroxyalkanoate synthesis regulator phasin
MKHAIYAVRTFLSDCKSLAQHGKLNRMIRFIESELPLIYDEMVKAQQRIEELEERIKKLEER